MINLNKIIQWNMQSYKSKFSELKILLNEMNPICVCLQETLHRDSTPPPPSGYNIVTSKRKRNDGHERGTAILINKHVTYEPINLNTTLQACAVKIYLDKMYSVCSLYLPHVDVSDRDLSLLVDQLTPPFLLLGDMNAHSPLWGEQTSDERGRIFENLLLNHNISLLNNDSPTHFHVQTGSLSTIDLSVCSSCCVLDLHYAVNDNLYSSDHFPIVITVNTTVNLGCRPERYITNRADWSTFSSLTVVQETVYQFNNIDDCVYFVETRFCEAADEAIPRSSGAPRRPPVPWWNDECTDAKEKKILAERSLRRNHSTERKISYNRAKAKCTYVCKQARILSWRDYVSSINERIGLNQVWKKVSKINGKFSPSPTPVLKRNGADLLLQPLDVANKLAEHFAGVSDGAGYSPEFKRYKARMEATRLNFHSNLEINYNEKFSIHELNYALSKTSESSPGIDKISYSMIKHCHPTMLTFILSVFNRIFTEHQFPTAWKTALIVPIPKPGKDPKEPSSYRPISLTSCLCKLMEKLVNIRLVWYLEVNNHIVPQQSGYRHNRSTGDNLAGLDHFLHDSIANRRHAIVIFFDIAKAYDTAWTFGVMMNLHRYGLRGNLPIFIKNFMSDRKICVRVGTAISESKSVLEGIPQGSVLSCTCFMVAMNTITDNIPQNVNSLLYVDDFTIFSSGLAPHSIERRLQITINGLERWSKMTGFSFSPGKCKAMHVCRKRNCPKLAANLTLNNVPLQLVDQYKFLGVIFDNSLTWRPHITEMKKSCHKVLDLLKHLSHKDWGADRSTLLRLYIMLLKPKIDYGSEVYSSACRTLLDSIEPIQNAAIRIATGAFRTSPIPSLRAESGIKPLSLYRNIKSLNYLSRLHVCPSNPLYNLVNDINANDLNNTRSKSFLHRIEQIRQGYDIDMSNLLIETPLNSPPWRLMSHVTVCQDLHKFVKAETNPTYLKVLFLNHFSSHENSICVFTDGSKTDDGVGYACVGDGIDESRRIQSTISNFTAELYAIHDALRYCIAQRDADITIATDSRSCIQAVVRYNHANPIVQKIQTMIIECDRHVNLCWVPSHVGVPLNERADENARNAIGEEIVPVPIARGELKLNIKSIIKDFNQREWQNIRNNKLREIKDSVLPFSNVSHVNREWEIKLSRLRIGHCQLTHSFLMEGSGPPYCNDCIVPLTIKHILAECPNYILERSRYLGNNYPALDKVLGTDITQCGGPLHSYLQAIGIYHKI